MQSKRKSQKPVRHVPNPVHVAELRLWAASPEAQQEREALLRPFAPQPPLCPCQQKY